MTYIYMDKDKTFGENLCCKVKIDEILDVTLYMYTFCEYMYILTPVMLANGLIFTPMCHLC